MNKRKVNPSNQLRSLGGFDGQLEINKELTKPTFGVLHSY